MRIGEYHIIYFIGIGGIGMSALARWFKQNGYAVVGYDRTSTALTSSLVEEGIPVHFEDAIDAIPEIVLHERSKALVVYTPAIPKDHQIFGFLKSENYLIKKRSQVLGMLTENQYAVAVAGTHGKTTTSTMIAHILHAAGKRCNAFLGGISTNFNSNLLISKDTVQESVMVVEADEYDRSFLTLFPNIAVITAVDPDHLDIYGDKDALAESFRDFINQLTANGKLILKQGLASLVPEKRKDISVYSYAVDAGEIRADNLRIGGDIFTFDYLSKEVTIADIQLKVPGYHNVENAIAAITVALQLGVSSEAIRDGLESFKGVKRRFEYVLRREDLTYIDDYAHHPVEIEAFLTSVKALYPGKNITAVFQPHLFSRTRDFLVEFAESLSLADKVWLLEIYPARELPIPGITSEAILEKITARDKCVLKKENLLAKIEANRPEVLVTIGAGDIDQFVLPIKQMLIEANELE